MTTKNTFQILGMMSGTSLDGLDMALCSFKREGSSWSYRLIRAGFKDYPPELRTQLEKAIGFKAIDLLALDAQYGGWLGQQAAAFLGSDSATLDAVASHGHTVHHRPELGFTFQLGAPQYVALSSGLPVIGDFRSGDIALGGQGAPLVPVGDRLLFSTYDFCLNLGGIANISFEQDGKRIAFDIGIANMLLNHLVRPLGLTYDSGGAIAREGEINTALLESLDGLAYYAKSYPKSTGYEWFSGEILPLLGAFPDRPENQLRTAAEHIARQVGVQVRSISKEGPGRILVTGGGALNTFLMELLQHQLQPGFEVVLPKRKLIEYKEAIIFGLLGALRLSGETNILASVTGARRDSCSGILCLP